jgi:hypothetical protein
MVIHVKGGLGIACVPDANEHPAPATDAEREATLLLLAFVGICSVIAVSIIIIVLFAVVGFGGLIWWLPS